MVFTALKFQTTQYESTYSKVWGAAAVDLSPESPNVGCFLNLNLSGPYMER